MTISLNDLSAGIVLAIVASSMLVAAPEKRLHQILAAALFLRAGVVLANGASAGALVPLDALTYARTSMWIGLVVPLSSVVVAAVAYPRRFDKVLTLTAIAITLCLLSAFAFVPSLFVRGVVALGSSRYAVDTGALTYPFAVLASAADALVAWRASRSVGPAGTASIVRAMTLGIAFALFPIYAASSFIVLVTQRTFSAGEALFFMRAAGTIVVGVIAAGRLPALAAGLRDGMRPVVFGGMGLVMGLGLLDAATLSGLLVIPGFGGSLPVVRGGFALLLALSAFRYGLVDVGSAGRTRIGWMLRVVLATLAGGVMLFIAKPSVGLWTAVLVGAVGFAAGVRLFANAGRALGERLLLPPDDPRAVTERARRYAAAVAASKDAGREGERYLAGLRDDLGISEREHELLVQGLASREKERYQPVEVLGQGATAQVQLAVDEVGGKRVVVKRFKGLRDPAAVLREARALAAVKHPRVVAFLEVDRRGDDVYLVLAYAEGGSARQLLDKEGPLPPARAVALTLDLLEGLEALHRQGMVHCDVKPENLLIDREGRGLLGDFGSARFSTPDLADSTLTGGAADGSLSTISPEALRNATPAPARDVYASGAVLYRLLTGQHYVALDGGTVFEARERIMLDAPRLPHPKVPVGVETVLRKALAKKPAERYPDAGAMREALAGALARTA